MKEKTTNQSATAQRITAMLPSLTEAQQRAVCIIVMDMAAANVRAMEGEKHGKA